MRALGKSTHKPLRDQRGIVAAETEGVIDNGVDREFARDFRDVIQIALRIGIFQVDRRRGDVRFHRFEADGHFHSTGGTEHVAGRALGGADDDLARVIAEDTFDRLSFGDVTLRRGSAVGVDVGNFSGIHPGAAQRHFHATRGTFAFG